MPIIFVPEARNITVHNLVFRFQFFTVKPLFIAFVCSSYPEWYAIHKFGCVVERDCAYVGMWSVFLVMIRWRIMWRRKRRKVVRRRWRIIRSRRQVARIWWRIMWRRRREVVRWRWRVIRNWRYVPKEVRRRYVVSLRSMIIIIVLSNVWKCYRPFRPMMTFWIRMVRGNRFVIYGPRRWNWCWNYQNKQIFSPSKAAT